MIVNTTYCIQFKLGKNKFMYLLRVEDTFYFSAHDPLEVSPYTRVDSFVRQKNKGAVIHNQKGEAAEIIFLKDDESLPRFVDDLEERMQKGALSKMRLIGDPTHPEASVIYLRPLVEAEPKGWGYVDNKLKLKQIYPHAKGGYMKTWSKIVKSDAYTTYEGDTMPIKYWMIRPLNENKGASFWKVVSKTNNKIAGLPYKHT